MRKLFFFQLGIIMKYNTKKKERERESERKKKKVRTYISKLFNIHNSCHKFYENAHTQTHARGVSA